VHLHRICIACPLPPSLLVLLLCMPFNSARAAETQTRSFQQQQQQQQQQKQQQHASRFSLFGFGFPVLRLLNK
jgi:hypothetical protein